VMATGFMTWQVNYMAKPLRPVEIKMSFSFLMLVVSVVLFSWRAAVPDVLTAHRWLSAVYLLLIFSLTPMVIVIGWYGAKMTFPIEKD
jgi:cytochrome bd-type quinol oxidase subunit 1